MDIIRFSNESVMNFLGGSQKRVKGFKYRFNKFLIKVEDEDDVHIWYNVFTGSIVALKGLEVNNLLTGDDYCDYEDILIQNYFLVPENFDEEELMVEYRRRNTSPITANCLTRLNSFTILTTTQCNARCFYCYLLHNKGKNKMTKETAEKVARYIIDSTFNQQTVSLGWFGGEPLFNKEVIDIITTKVESSGRKVQAGIISNSYLFDKKTCKKAVRDWHITNVQVTLDGTEEVYNKSKNYIYKDDPSPFKTIIKNIHNMLDSGLIVSVRMNVGLHNVDDLKELILFLSKEFKGKKNFSAYIHELFDENLERTDEENRIIFENMKILEDLLTENNLRIQGANIPHGIRTIHCMVDDDKSVIIMPDGSLGLCEHYETAHFIGHIDNPTNIDMKEVLSWRKMSEYTNICKDCPYKPACLKCNLCPDHNICNKYEKAYLLKRTEEDLKLIYKDWINNFNKQNSCLL